VSRVRSRDHRRGWRGVAVAGASLKRGIRLNGNIGSRKCSPGDDRPFSDYPAAGLSWPEMAKRCLLFRAHEPDGRLVSPSVDVEAMHAALASLSLTARTRPRRLVRFHLMILRRLIEPCGS
jgi:hypothetical protein